MVQEFVLLGFSVGQQGRMLLFALFTAIYTLTLAENFIIIMIYPKIMSQDSCYALVAICWIIGMVVYVVPVVLISRLSFCGPNFIDHFLCDPGPILALACPPVGYVASLFNVIVSFGLLATFVFIVVSYGFVGITLVKASSQSSRGKGFSTVSSHLAVVTLFFGSVAAMYAVPNGESHATVTKVVTLFYSSVTPLFNPLIYCLKNDQVKEAMTRLLKKNRVI
ncbi:UNVERIFIED_CONTAM: hypothetical protein K2H54_035050 [Gekko kuhli]